MDFCWPWCSSEGFSSHLLLRLLLSQKLPSELPPPGLLPFAFGATCMSRRSLTDTIRSAVAALRSALSELEDSGPEWELVDSPRAARGDSSAASCADSSAAPPAREPVEFSAPVPEASASQSVFPRSPRPGDPLPGEALFLVSSLRREDRASRANRAWQAGLQAGAVLRGDQRYPDATPPLAVRSRVYICLRLRGDRTVRFFTSFGRFKLYVGSLERSDTVCHGFPTEGESRVYARAAGARFPDSSEWN